MIDLHSHILPGIDDGPGDLSGSLALARTVAEDGTRRMAATPHIREDYPRVRPAEIGARCRELNEHLRAADTPLEVISGGEVDLLWAQRAAPHDLNLVSFAQAGSDLLVETPYGWLPPNFEALLVRLTDQGYRVLLAHPERSESLQRRPERVVGLVRQGVLLQVTAEALVSSRRSRSGKLATALVANGLAHVIASDAHHANLVRRPTLSEGVGAARRIAPGRAEWMVTDAPAAILAGQALPRPPSGRRPRFARLQRGL